MKTTIHIELPSGKKLDLTPADLKHLRKELAKLDDAERNTEIESFRKKLEELRDKKPEKEYVPMPYPVYPAPYLQPSPYTPRWGEIWCGPTSLGLESR